MSVIIRLQNLPWSANAADIRQYFQGLSIPEGGVHIVGGEKGDAFISFSTDEDARQAMLSDGGCIKEVQIRLLLSSRNEMQKVIETARQQTMQMTQAYIQIAQPQLTMMNPLTQGLPPLTAKVLPQPQQQQRPDRLVAMLHRHQPIIDAAAVLMSQDKQQQPQLQQQPQQQYNLSPKSSENKDRDDKGNKRERTRSKSRDRRSKSSRSGGGSGSKRERSRSRDRRRRDRSRGRDRSRDRHRNDGSSRNSSSRGSGGKSNRSRSPVMKSIDGNKVPTGDQPTPIRPWACQYNNMQHQMAGTMDNRQPASMAINDAGSGGAFSQFRTPPQPPIVPIHPMNNYQQQQQPKNDWTVNNEERHQTYAPDNNFQTEDYGGSNDEDDRQDEYDNNFSGRYGDGPAARRGQQGQQFHNQQGGFGPIRGGRFHRHPMSGGQHNRGHRNFDDFGGGGGPRFNNPQSRYGGGGAHNVPDGGSGGRPSRFNSMQDGVRPARNGLMPPRRDGNAPDFDETKRIPPRYNDRYRYDIRNAQTPRSEGLCIEVNNMSGHFSYGDIRKLFEGIHIDGSAIKIQKHRQGVVFVRFDSNQNKNLALGMNGTAYKGSQIVVKHLDDEAYERENTDDRPYPTAAVATTSAVTATASGPTVVDHVDLVDDDDEEDGKNKTDQTGVNKKQQDGKTQNANDDQSDDDCNLVVCEKNNKDAAAGAPAAADAGDKKSSSTTSQQQDPPTKYLKLQQFPITVTEEEILNEIDSSDEIRRVTIYPDGEFLGAALEFHNVEAAEAMLKRCDCVLLCSTPVPVLRCSYKEYVQIKRKSGGGGRRFSDGGGGGGNRHHHHSHHQQQHQQSTMAPPPPSNMPMVPLLHSNCVYVYGLPTTVTNTDITQFFGDTSVLPDKIHIMLSKLGRPTGESYCEFTTAQQAHTALSKDQCYMGPNLVYVEPISRSDMIQAITKPMQQHHQDMSWGGGIRGGGGPSPRQQHNMPRQHHHGGPPSSYGNGGGHNHNGPFGNRPNQQYMNNGGGGRGSGGGYTPRMRGPGPGPDGFGQPGCVVALDNVPYRADVQEIVDFFDGFDLNSQNVIRRFNDYGKPTGEARVNLRNPQEAMRAVRVLQNKSIFNRPVQLTLL